MTIHSIIKSETGDKRNISHLYNSFFSISIKFSKNLHSYLEIYFSSILDLIKHKLNDNKNDLKTDYNNIIDSIINKSYSIIYTKKERRDNSSGYIMFI